jgi:hypothetical protein
MSYIKVYPNIDADAQAFLTAAAITDPTISSSINKLVVDLKSAGVWTKMKAIYPMVGGTASTHKWNLKDPRDLDAAFRLQFNGGWTHSANGALPNGTNGYADTFLTPSTTLSQNSTNISVYSRTNTSNPGSDIGSSNLLFGNGLYITPSHTNGSFYARVNGNNIQFLNYNSLGYFIGTRTNSNVAKVFINNTLRATDTLSSTGLSNFTLNISALNVGGTRTFSNRQIAFATIGDGLTDTEAANLYTAVQAFQTTLNRQV